LNRWLATSPVSDKRTFIRGESTCLVGHDLSFIKHSAAGSNMLRFQRVDATHAANHSAGVS